jgi:hypothetical protein
MKSFRVWKVWDGFGCVVSLATIFDRPAHHACINGYTLRLAGVVSLLAFGLPLAGSAAPRQQLSGGHVPAAVARLAPVGSLPGSQRLNLAIGLPLRNKQELDALLQQLYDPTSPNYHRYLKPEEFTTRFGPTEQDYQALIAFARTNGLEVTSTHPNRVLLDVSGPVSAVEKVFRVKLHVYPHPTEGRNFYAPDVEPSLDLAVPVSAIAGLNNYFVPHPANLFRPIGDKSGNASPCLASGSGTNGSYMGNDFRAAYAPGVTLTGTGQAVGLFELDGYYTNDITSYETTNNLSPVPLQNLRVDEVSGIPGYNWPLSNENAEVAMDIEVAISMAPGLSQVIVYEGPRTSQGAYDTLSRMATDNLAKQLSSSWVIEEILSTPTLADSIYPEFAAQGQSFFQASGDHGAYPTYQYADNPYTTIVGGTALTTTGRGGSWKEEITWNDGYTNGGYWATGGGISANYSIPSWQQGIDMSGNQGSPTMRNVPDVAMVARDIFVVTDRGVPWVSGGTSAAAPLWAGFTALVNEQAAASRLAPVGFLNPALYTIAKGTNYARAFHDVTMGNNTNGTSRTQFYAVPGYDLCTGWGTPNGANLINLLVAAPRPVFPPWITSQPQSQTVTAGSSVTLSVVAWGTAPLSYQWSLNGQSISAATGSSYSIARVQSSDAGTYWVVVTNSYGSVTSDLATLAISSASAFGIIGAPFKYQIIANNNPTWYSASGLPSGLSCDGATGLISGTPTRTGTFSVNVQARNIFGSTASATVVFTIANGAITSATSAQGVLGVLFNYQIAADNSPSGYSASGLPPSLSCDVGSGLISGTPVQAGTFSVNVQARNLYGTASATILFTIANGAITSATSAQGVIGVPFGYQIIANNNPTWCSASGLPSGLSCDGATGVISGTPTRTGAFSVTVQAKNVLGSTVAATVLLTIANGAVTSATSAQGVIGAPFGYQIIANNNPTWYSASGLPSGLSCDGAAGFISGTPTRTGTFSVTVEAINISGSAAAATVLFTIADGAIISGTSAQGVIGVPFSYEIIANNNPTWYSASGLPSGLSCDGATGFISGIPTQAGTFSVPVQARNILGSAAAATISLTISGGTIGGASQPALAIVRTGNSVLLTWPVTSGGYVLEETQLQPNAWTNSSAPVVVQGSNNVATITTAVSAKFYRLRK